MCSFPMAEAAFPLSARLGSITAATPTRARLAVIFAV